MTPVRLPVEAPGTSVTLQLVDQRRLIVNSLVKPLLMLVLFVVAAELAGLTEEVTVLAAVAGFCSGLWLCRAMSWDILKFSGDDLC